MAAVAMPGFTSADGPCEDCEHVDCIADRALVAKPCEVCTKPIGFDRPFFQEDNWTKLTHAVCA